MKRKYWCFGLALCLALAGCGQKEASPVPTSEPSPSIVAPATLEPSTTPEPSFVPSVDPGQDPEGYLLACLDKVMEGKRVFIRFWQHPGSGPSPVELSSAERGEEIKALFSALEWERVEEPGYYTSEEEAVNAPFNQPGAYSASIYYGEPWSGYISLWTGDPVVMIGDNGPDSVYLRADGAEELCDKLADLTPSAYINLGRTRVPEQKDQEATLKLYLETALERLKANGHITDYTIDDFAIIPPEEPESEPVEELEHPGIPYTVTYSLKPTKPELSDWQGLVGEDGWVEQTIDWECIAYDERDGCYGMY